MGRWMRVLWVGGERRDAGKEGYGVTGGIQGSAMGRIRGDETRLAGCTGLQSSQYVDWGGLASGTMDEGFYCASRSHCCPRASVTAGIRPSECSGDPGYKGFYAENLGVCWDLRRGSVGLALKKGGPKLLPGQTGSQTAGHVRIYRQSAGLWGERDSPRGAREDAG
jgi:hypothetical protein